MIKIGIGLGSRYFTASGGASPASPSALPVPQNLRLAASQSANSITVEWDALPDIGIDYQVEVYTPDDVWVSLGGTMGTITKQYGVSDGMVYGATYSFRVRSTFDFVTFSDWSTPLYGVAAPPQSYSYQLGYRLDPPPTAACSIEPRQTYYSNSSFLNIGNALYQDIFLSSEAQPGSYSNGIEVYIYSGGITFITFCSPPPTPPPPTPP